MSTNHVQKGGEAYYDGEDFFLFAPDNVKAGLTSFRANGTGQLSSDGTFEFVRSRRIRAQSELIKRTTHIRLSRTKDEAVQMTFKVYDKEAKDYADILVDEMEEIYEFLFPSKRKKVGGLKS